MEIYFSAKPERSPMGTHVVEGQGVEGKKELGKSDLICGASPLNWTSPRPSCCHTEGATRGRRSAIEGQREVSPYGPVGE